jgi:hypothetical protein
MGLSTGERILLFLSTAHYADDPFGGFDQETISRECGIGRTHVPRSIRPLIERSLVAKDKGRSPGRNRMVKRYSITLEGQREASSISDRINRMKVTLIGPDGLKNTTDPASILSLANAYLARLSKPTIGMPLLLSTDSNILTWNSIIALSTSRDLDGSVELPSGWRPVDAPEVPFDYLRRPKDESALSSSIDSDEITVVEGGRGSGRRTLLSYVLRERDLGALWIERCEGSAPTTVKAGSDILVMMDEVQPDPASLFFKECDVTPDPRDDGQWEEPFRSAKLVIVRYSGRPLNASTVSVGPIDLETFSKALSGLGLGDEAAKAVHVATNGSPAAYKTIKDMGPHERAELTGADFEKALFRLLISLGRSKGTSKVT